MISVFPTGTALDLTLNLRLLHLIGASDLTVLFFSVSTNKYNIIYIVQSRNDPDRNKKRQIS